MKSDEIRKLLGMDTISKKGNIYTVRKEFFYRHGMDALSIAGKVKEKLPDATIVDYGEHWAPFRGGASVAQSSHWWVKFTLGSKQDIPNFMKLK